MEGGGSERQTLNLLSYLDRKKIAPGLYLLSRKGQLLEDVPEDIEIDSFWSRNRYPQINWPGRINRMQVRDLVETIRYRKTQVLYDRLFHMALLAGPAAKRTGVKRIAAIVSPPQNDLLSTERRFVWLKRWALSASYKGADKLLTVSKGTAESASKFYGIPIDRFEIVLSPVDVDRIERLKTEAWEGKQFTPTKQKIVSVGRLSREKGHSYLIDGVAHVIRNTQLNPELHLVGDGPLRDALERQAISAGIQDSVVFHGQVANPYAILSQADLFCLPSLYEGLPNALLEAMVCGIPSMASNCEGGIQEATLDGKLTHLFTKSNVVAIAKGIEDRFTHANAWQATAKEAQTHVKSAHSLPGWIQKMESIITSVLHTK